MRKTAKAMALLTAASMIMTAFTPVYAESTDTEDTAAVDWENGENIKAIKEKGVITVATGTYVPFEYRDDDDNIVGFDIDVATEVANRMGVELKLQPIEWSTKEMELNTGSVDCLWNGLSIDDERKQAMDLSEPYMTNRMVLVVLNDSEYTDQASLAGKTIGVQNGSTAEKILEESDFSKTIGNTIGFKDNVTAFMELETKGIDAIFMDEVVANYAITSQNKDFKVLEDGLTEEEYAVGFKKGNTALKNEVQKYIDEMKADGTMTQISEKWFGKDVVSR